MFASPEEGQNIYVESEDGEDSYSSGAQRQRYGSWFDFVSALWRDDRRHRSCSSTMHRSEKLVKPMQGSTSFSQLMREDEDILKNYKGISRWVGTKWAFLYFIWSNRNRLVFKGEKKRVSDSFHEL